MERTKNHLRLKIFDYKGTLKLSLVREQNFKLDLAKLDLLSIKLKLLNLYQFYNILQIFCYFFKNRMYLPQYVVQLSFVKEIHFDKI